MESCPVHSIFTPKEVITDVTTQRVTSVTNRVKIHSFLEREGTPWFYGGGGEPQLRGLPVKTGQTLDQQTTEHGLGDRDRYPCVNYKR